MIELPKCEYNKLIEPLRKVTINNLFARAVVENRVSGTVYVDSVENPKTFYVVHPYGMSLLFGHNENNDFNTSFKNHVLNEDNSRTKDELMQAFPADWDSTLNELFKEFSVNGENKNVEFNTRVNFRFNPNKYLNFRGTLQPEKYTIKRSGREIFSKMRGSVVPNKFWDTEDDFFRNAIAFSLYVDGKLTTTAFSAFIHDDKLELGMETFEEFRGKGYARAACSMLIDYCLENNYEPIWACSQDNIGSYKLAQKLGFDPDITIPYYRLIQ